MNIPHFLLLVVLVYKVAAVLKCHKRRQGVNKLFSVQHRGRHQYHTVRQKKEALNFK